MFDRLHRVAAGAAFVVLLSGCLGGSSAPPQEPDAADDPAPPIPEPEQVSDDELAPHQDPRPPARLATNVTFDATLGIKTYIWVPEDELQAQLPAGWEASCHEYVDGRCAFEGHISEVTVEHWFYDAAFIGDERVPGGTWTAVLLNAEPPDDIAQSSNDILDVDWILYDIFASEPALNAWLQSWNLTTSSVADATMTVDMSGEPGLGAWVGQLNFEAPGIELSVPQANLGYRYLPAYNHGRMYVPGTDATGQPSVLIRHEQTHDGLYGLSRGRSVAQGTLPGFSDSEWKDDHAWIWDPTPITWLIQDAKA